MSIRDSLTRSGAARIAHWLTVEIGLFWLCIAAIIAVVVASQLMSSTIEQALRFSGTGLQLLGILSVGWDIRSKRKAFNLDGLPAQIIKWFAARPWRTRAAPKVIEASATITANASATAFGSAKPGPGSTMEQRVEWLEKQRDLDAVAIGEAKDAIKKESQARAKALEELQREHQRQVKEINTKLKVATTGSLSFAVVGLVWLSIGVVFGTAATDIARLIDP